MRLPKIFNDGCVLQHGEPIRVWGITVPAAEVTVAVEQMASDGTVDIIRASCHADKDGRWQAVLDALMPGGPYQLNVEDDTGSVAHREVYAGEVFLCSGQSNMELPMQWVRPFYEREFHREPDPLLRQYKVVDRYDFEGPVFDHEEAHWAGCSNGTLGEFSAVAYFFGRMVRETYGVPVGLLNVSLGGSPIESWIDEDTLLSNFPQFKDDLAPYRGPGVAKQKSEASLEAVDQWLREMEQVRGVHTEHPRSQVTLPASIEDCGLPQFQGLLEFSRTVMLPPYCEGREAFIRLGAWADVSATFVNGVQVGTSPNRYEQCDYTIPAGVLKAGANEVSVQLICNDGHGRITDGKPMQLQIGDEIHALSGTWAMEVLASMDRPCPSEDFVRWKPIGLYNAMLAPCIGYGIKAVLWYQGESNTGPTAPIYDDLLKALIETWRADWHQPDLSFLVVQLPSLDIDVTDDGGWPLVREAQMRVAEQLTDVRTVVTLDAGEANDLHPHNKKLVAARLFEAARDIVFRDRLEPSLAAQVEWADDGSRDVLVTCVDETGAPVNCLTLDGNEPGEFSLVWLDAFTTASVAAHIDQGCIRIPVGPRKPDILRYAWSNNPHLGLIADERGTLLGPFAIAMETPEEGC